MDSFGTHDAHVLDVPHYGSQYVELLAPTGAVCGTGTGFFVKNRRHQSLLITNRHVVTGGERWDDDNPAAGVVSALRVTVPLATSRAGHFSQFVVPLGDEDEQPVWLEHAQHGRGVDVVAIPLDWADAAEEVDPASYALVLDVARLEVTDTLYVVGFPVGFDSIEKNIAFGIWTKASIAWPPFLDWNGLPSFLVDGRTRPGQSGSPVIHYAGPLDEYKALVGGVARGPVYSLIGVYSGRIHEESDIGIVWKRSVVEDIITDGVKGQGWVAPLAVQAVETDYWVRPLDYRS